MRRWGLHFIFCFFLFCCYYGVMGIDFEFPPLFDFDEDLEIEGKADEEIRYFGPLGEYSFQLNPYREFHAFRPFYSSEEKEKSYAFDILWPLFVYRENDFEKYWRFFLLYSGRNKVEDGETEVKRNSDEKPHTGFIPLWLYGWDKEDKFYWALFPLYGEAKDILAYDSINFILFPLYLRTEKGEDVKGEAYLWPIVNWDEGKRFKKFRVFPFYAYHNREGSFRRSSYIWPFYHKAEYFMGDNKTGEGWMLFPFYGENRFKDLKTYSVLWPLFSYHRRESDDGERLGVGFSAPWPLVEYKDNADRDKAKLWKLYIWPLLGRLDRTNSKYQFVLWPLFSSLYTSGDQGRVEWVWLLPLYWSKHGWSREGELKELYRNFYPFVSYCERGDDCEIRIFDIWFQRNMPAVERNWSPLWRIFSYQTSGESFRYDFLWGLLKYYMYEKENQGFQIFPFYHSKWNFRKSILVNKAGDGDEPDQTGKAGSNDDEAIGEVSEDSNCMVRNLELQRDFLLGFLRLKKWDDGSQTMRLLWCIEFDF